MKKKKERVRQGLLPQHRNNGSSKKSLEGGKRIATYILDTNVLLADPEVLFRLSGRIIIPMAVVGELDKFKSLPDARDPKAVAARKITRSLDALGTTGDISRGARTVSGSTVMIYRSHAPVSGLASSVDNKVVGTAVKIRRAGRAEVSILSNDKNLRNVARAFGITATGYPFLADSCQPAACEEVRNWAEQEKDSSHETVNPEQRFHVSWQHLLLAAAVIIAIALLTVGR